MGKKVALLIGIGNYGSGLKTLQCPANGVNAMNTVLAEPEIGGFDEVIPLIDPDVGTMRSQIGAVFGRLAKSDLALFYFTGHGIKDMTGEFYLTTAQTQLFDNGRLNPGTAVEAEFVKRVMGNCYAQRKVIILDCCFGAAFAEGFLTMDDGGVDLEAELGGKGWVVLTAATARNYALEQEGEPLSVYTRYLTEGLRTGAAAKRGNAYISVGQLHDYLRTQVQKVAPTMSPEIFNARQGQAIQIAKAAIATRELTYREAIRSKIRRGQIGGAGRVYLNTLQQQLQLPPQRAAELETQELQPYAQKQAHLDTYRQALLAEIEVEYPLGDDAIADLQDLQKLLNLRDRDVRPLVIKTLQALSVRGDVRAMVSRLFSPPEITQPALPEPSQIQLPAIDIPLRSARGIDYQPLVELLRSQQWQEADQFTRQQMLKIAGRTTAGWLRGEDWENFPATDLQTIDQLWQAYSSDRFGLSLQIAAWESAGAHVDLETMRTVGIQLGWKPPEGYWKEPEGYTYNLSAPPGHLPTQLTKVGSLGRKFQAVAQKLRRQLPEPANAIGEPAQPVNPRVPHWSERWGMTAQSYPFETMRVNERGDIVERIAGEAECFVEDLGNGVTLEMVYIPGGEFLMGASEDEAGAFSDEPPQHRVTVPEFSLGKFAVTQAQYAAITGKNPSHFKGDQRPVERGAWQDAVAFCKALTDRTGKRYRLPSEAEWEYACRAHTSTPFAFGPTLTPDLANYDGNYSYGQGPEGTYRQQTTEVGQFLPNGLGLYDLHGNVWEWCADGWHYTYDGAPSDGTAWTAGGEQNGRVIRGGAWNVDPRLCRSASRLRLTPDLRNYDIGFRVVCSPPRT
ncbi:caspase, EACC1-associated type [Leptolyngbya iicbica]|uniref:Sulfatase-modifying factor protein n=2 Tax=Cyanophyceae TaxID=3028117 RepID=A0A4Q7E812_9CYAN|nr:SUMF1/EgtB/PvdO family nonheme iron enzyme [Leptolyngbya sp. LK]RZM78631.1 hypothetical protein DYY88_07450 [Leptolyngbya sp. LK]